MMAEDIAARIGADPSLLLVDDDELFVTRLARAMEKRGFATRTALSVSEAMRMIREQAPAFAVIDLRLEDGNGLDVVESLRETREDARIIVLTGYGAIATAVAAVSAAMRVGHAAAEWARAGCACACGPAEQGGCVCVYPFTVEGERGSALVCARANACACVCLCERASVRVCWCAEVCMCMCD